MSDTKSVLASKINWTQIVAFLAMIASLWGFELSGEEQAVAATGIAAVWAAGTIVFRTFFTRRRIG